MKVLTIGSDRNLFVSQSESQKRIKEYGKLFEELHIIVYTKYNADDENNMPMMRIADNIFIYPTNTWFKPLYFLDAYQIAKKIILDSRFQIPDSVITAQDPFETGLVGWLLKLKFKLPLQIQIHTDVFSPYFWKESLKNKLRVMLAKFLLPKVDGIRVVSERIKQSLVSSVKCQVSRIVVLPIFVPVKRIQSKKIKVDLRQKYLGYDFIILMASRLTKEKNIGMAIEAMKTLLQNQQLASSVYNQHHRHYNPLLLIVGDGPEREALKLQITNYKLQNNVILEPWTDDLVSYYKTADLFLLTSNYEGYGRAVIEAMAAGLPVVMTDVGLAGELLIDDLDGRIIPVGDNRRLIQAILELKEDVAKREKFKSSASKFLENWPAKQAYLEKYKNSLDSKTMLK